MSVQGRVFAVTGGGSGMGAAICTLLAQRGARAVAASDLSKDGLDTLKASLKKINVETQVDCTVLDVTITSAVEDWIKGIVDKFGDLHGACNAAGFPQRIGETELPNILGEPTDAWNRVFKVNLDGVFYCTRAQIKAMKSLNKTDRGIVNISSMASLEHVPDIYAYRTSKAACAHFTQSVAKDCEPFGIRVNCVSPGSTQTPMLNQFMDEKILQGFMDRGWVLMEPTDVARAVVWLLSEDSRPVFGANLNVGAAIP
ncbi:hypothetical protein RBB50_012830 [Rhinocladiella similis]